MRFMLFLSMLLLGLSAQASTVNVDFESVVGSVAPFSEQGLLFNSSGLGVASVGGAPGTDGVALGCGRGCTFEISTVDSSLFGLISIDVYVGGVYEPGIGPIFVELTGYFSGGSIEMVNTNLAFSGDGATHTFFTNWADLEKVEVFAFVCDGCIGGFAIDNVHASIVPIPAAVWLFGSGLGLLVWFRRKA